MNKTNKKSPAENGVITDFTAFRRAIHLKGRLRVGISQNRKLVPTDRIQTIVSSLMDTAVYRGVCASNAFPDKYNLIKGTTLFSPANQSVELLWNASIISAFSTQINEYIYLRDVFTCNFLKADWDDAKAALDLIEEKFGHSLWLINCRISLLQQSSGTREHQALLSTIVSTPGINPIVAYISYLYSFSIEEGVSVSDLRNEFRDANGLVYEYIRYHLVPSDITVITQPHSCISYEENSPIIDRFETYVEMVQLLFVRNEAHDVLRQAISQINTIVDRRIANLGYALGLGGKPFLDARVREICDSYTSADYVAASRGAADAMGTGDGSPWVYEILGRSQSYAGVQPLPSSPGTAIVQDFQSFGVLSKDLIEIHRALSRQTIAHRKLPTARVLVAMLDRKLDPIVLQKFSENEMIWAMSSPFNLPQILTIIRTLSPSLHASTVGLLDCSSPTISLHVSASSPDFVASDAEQQGVPKDRIRLFASYAAYNRGDLDIAIGLYREYESEAGKRLSPRAVAFQYALLKAINKDEDALRAFADAYVSNEKIHALFAMRELAVLATEEAAVDGNAIDRSIMLHAYSTHINELKDGDISDAFEDTLDFFNTDFPYELITNNIPPSKLIYFLRHVASVHRLEDTTRFDSLDAIETERMRILQWLVEADGQNRAAYTQEISNITKDQEVARLSAEFERSKIYVHEEGIRRTFENEIKGDFARYRHLIADPQASSQTAEIQVALRRLLKEGATQFAYLIIPSTEAVQMFESLFTKAMSTIIFDPNHGFKTYLSTRILHGVIEGELRSSFVREQIVFATDANGPDQFMEAWSQSLSSLDLKAAGALADHVSRFSQKVVDAILDLKDAKIRIVDKKTPLGIFRFDVDEGGYERLRSSITATTTYEEFLDRLMASFWESMDHCLEGVKKELATVFRKRIAASFDILEAAILKEAPGGQASELADAVARCRSTFLRDLERVSSWFGRAGIQSKNPFLLETAIHVATLITNNCYPRYPLMPELTQDRSHRVAGELLNPIVDLLTNCLQNASEHAGFNERAPSVDIKIQRSTDISVCVETSIAEGVDIDAVTAEIEELLGERDDLNPLAVAGERRSGIRKMKRIVKHDLRSTTRLSISVDKSRSIRLEFTIPGRFVDEHCLN